MEALRTQRWEHLFEAMKTKTGRGHVFHIPLKLIDRASLKHCGLERSPAADSRPGEIPQYCMLQARLGPLGISVSKMLAEITKA